jgi:uncharacterized protein (TIGR02118 family)
MTIKIIVLYPHPKDEAAFEQQYLTKHLPLMRQILGADVPLITYRALAIGTRPTPYHRVAEIHFPDRAHFEAFARSDGSRIGSQSAFEVSTGGPPVTLVCEEQPPV